MDGARLSPIVDIAGPLHVTDQPMGSVLEFIKLCPLFEDGFDMVKDWGDVQMGGAEEEEEAKGSEKVVSVVVEPPLPVDFDHILDSDESDVDEDFANAYVESFLVNPTPGQVFASPNKPSPARVTTMDLMDMDMDPKPHPLQEAVDPSLVEFMIIPPPAKRHVTRRVVKAMEGDGDQIATRPSRTHVVV